uniref:Putative secreted protein n=1 Tax=Anopheles darlingi TaxID=43151 RepID=A0A2M4D8R6_ANODA
MTIATPYTVFIHLLVLRSRCRWNDRFVVLLLLSPRCGWCEPHHYLHRYVHGLVQIITLPSIGLLRVPLLFRRGFTG